MNPIRTILRRLRPGAPACQFNDEFCSAGRCRICQERSVLHPEHASSGCEPEEEAIVDLEAYRCGRFNMTNLEEPLDTTKAREAAGRMLVAAEFPSDVHQVDLMLQHPWAAGIVVRHLQRVGKLEEVEKAILDEHHGTDTAAEYGPMHQAAHGNAPEVHGA